jgi:hypothetical protein
MPQQNKVYHISLLKIAILASLSGLMTIGCQSFATDNKQQIVTEQNTINTNNTSQNISKNNNENYSERNQENEQIYANVSADVSLQTNMAYREARSLIMQQGWQPNLQGEPTNLRSPAVKELFDLGYQEIKDCAGTVEGDCRFEFVNNQGELLVVTAITRGYENKRRFVKKWWIEKNQNIAQSSSSNKITDGYYALGGTGQGLEVRGQKYRYYDEEGQKPWQSINYLQSPKNGVVFDGKDYWCLSTLVPQGKPAVCSPNGWHQPEILPFIGTKSYNFLSGSGTGQSMTITNDGNVIIKIHGTQESEIIYRGQFTNPIRIENEFGLLIEGNKIYQLDVNGKMTTGCKGEGKVCESELY